MSASMTGTTIRAAKARYVMVGGFLGAGKTTAIIRLAEHLRDGGQRVGLITNDQSVGLVDTALVRSHGFSVEEITGGCFCCRFSSLMDAAQRLSAATRPDVFVAEPVGSCTDLRAAVSYPLRRIYGDAFAIAPLSVVVDPVRAQRVLGLAPGRSFSAKVRYVYDRQLAEADLIVVNKVDLIDADMLDRLRRTLGERYPHAAVLAVSARHGEGLTGWFARLVDDTMGPGAAPDVDYQSYAEGEAALGWVNATVQLSARRPFDGNAALTALADAVAHTIAPAEIAHLKMTLTPDELAGDIAVLNLVADDRGAELAQTLKGEIATGELIINLRAEADPDRLRAATEGALREWAAGSPGREAATTHIEHFRPAEPRPTHRMATLE